MNNTTQQSLDIEALMAACHIVSNGLNPSESITQLLEILVSTVGLDKVRVLLPDENNIYRIEYHFGVSAEERKKAEYHYGEGITGRVAQTREIALIPDIKNEPRFLGKITDLSIFNQTQISFIALPIILNNQKVGVLAVNRLNANVPILESDISLLQLFSAFIKQALDIHDLVQKRTNILREENDRLKERLSLEYDRKDIIGENNALLDTLEKAKQSAKTDVSIFVMGESGTGKERFAQFVHKNSRRSTKAFIALNCAAIPDNLLESELFGHEKGAFTGADKQKIGKFEAANGGTLFLDEIGDMNPEVQSKLLRVLQESEITRLGSNQVIKVNVRIIAATHQHIQSSIADGRFRLDLYYRLNVVSLKLPALRERKEDVPLLAEHFLHLANKRNEKKCFFSVAAVSCMQSYQWPGNIRQLENLVERCVILSTADEIDVQLVESGLSDDYILRAPASDVSQISLPQSMGDARPYLPATHLKKEEIIQSIVSSRGNKTLAAKRLGLSVRQLQYRIKKLDISNLELEIN